MTKRTTQAGATSARTTRRRIAGERTTRSTGEQRLRLVAPSRVPLDTAPRARPGQEQPPEPAPASTEPVPRADRQAGALAGTPTEARARAPKPAAGRGPSTLVLVVLAVLAAGVVSAAAWFAVPAWRARAVDAAEQSAPSVAERAAASILSYDYTSLDHDEKAAAGYMTPAYRKKYEHTFALVKSHAPEVKAKVTARVLGSGVSVADADHAHVLLFVDQTTRSTANAAPQVALNRVMFDMVRQDGAWRVAGITSY